MTTIKVPKEALPSIIELLTAENERLNDRLKEMTDRNSEAQYRLEEMKNQINALKNENKRLWGLYEHSDEKIGGSDHDF